MRSVSLFIFILCICCTTHAQEIKPLNLKQGVNYIKLNKMGQQAIFLLSTFENNTSHPSNTLNVFIKDVKGHYFIVPVPDTYGFTWIDVKLSAVGTKISSFKVYRSAGEYFIVSAQKAARSQLQEEVIDDLPVQITKYKLSENHDDPGVSLYFWKLIAMKTLQEAHQDIDEILAEFISKQPL